MNKSINVLQKFIVKLRYITILRETLGTALLVPVATRWLSHLSMIENFFDNKENICEVLTTYFPEFLPKFRQLSQDQGLLAYRKVLEPVKKRITYLEGEDYVTVSSYAPAFALLWDLWTKWTHSSDNVVKSLSISGLEALNRKRLIWGADHRLMAAFLDPTQKEKLLKTSCEHIDKEKIRQLVKRFANENQQITSPEEEEIEDEFFVKPKRQALPIDKELSMYEDDCFTGVETNSLDYWQKQEKRLPLLAKFSRKILPIPASSSPSERAFSRFRFTTPPTRNRLDTSRIQQLMYMQSVFKNEESHTN